MDPAFRRIGSRIDELGRISDEAGRLTRTFLSPAMARASGIVAEWMRDAGMRVEEPGWGNVVGRAAGTRAGAGTLVLGSHLDTVRDAGKFDGALGVVTALAAWEYLASRGIQLPYDLEIVAFSDEEGVRFRTPYLGSKALTGQITTPELSLLDAQGISLAKAAGAVPTPRYGAQKPLGYVEVHIEQGPLLEQRNMALGVVSHIAAQTRMEFVFTGHAGHAGTTPMEGRKDALAAAAAFVLSVEALAKRTPMLTATVGRLEAFPNAGNVIPGRVVLSLDIRHPSPTKVAAARKALEEEAAAIARGRGLEAPASTVLLSQEGVACSPALTDALAKAAALFQTEIPRLVSGAGHDGVVLSQIAPVAMLFVRCRAGLSHHPDEFASPEDMALAGQALAAFLEFYSP